MAADVQDAYPGAVLTLAQAARAAGVSAGELRRRAQSGQLTARTVRRRAGPVTVIALKDLEREFGASLGAEEALVPLSEHRRGLEELASAVAQRVGGLESALSRVEDEVRFLRRLEGARREEEATAAAQATAGASEPGAPRTTLAFGALTVVAAAAIAWSLAQLGSQGDRAALAEERAYRAESQVRSAEEAAATLRLELEALQRQRAAERALARFVDLLPSFLR